MPSERKYSLQSISSDKRQSIAEEDEEAKWLTWVKKQFMEIAGEDQEIDMQEFKTALKVKKSFFAERFFCLFDTDKSGTIELPELMEGLIKLTKGTPKEKLKFLFDVYDVDGSGTIDPDELKTVLKSCMEESSMQLSEDALDALTMALFQSADDDDSGEITFEELVAELERHPGVMENLTISAANWLKPPDENKPKKPSVFARYCSRAYIKNNLRKVLFLLIYFLLNVFFFTLSAVRYRSSNFCVIIARGCGMALNFNCTMIVVLMLRYCLSWLRTTRLGNYLPIDQNILFHKMVGVVIAFFSIVHTLAHLGNIAIVLYFSDNDDESLPAYDNSTMSPNVTQVTPGKKLAFWEYLFTLRSGVGWVGPGFAYLSGVILDIVLLIMVVCSMGFVRKGGHFQVFYWSHLLFVVFWILLLMHGPIFWCFFLVPGFIYLVERILRSTALKLIQWGRIYVTEVHLLPSKVTHLVITKPSNFKYKPGDYIFINIPEIASSEWHPFTISSAPEMGDKIWLHIRSAGSWTNKVYDYFDQLPELQTIDDLESGDGYASGVRDRISGLNSSFSSKNRVAPNISTQEKKQSVKNGTVKARTQKVKDKKVKVEVFIDGPFGTPTREIFETDHAVLVGSGIGVTPFASILQSVMYRYTASKVTCPHCNKHWYGDIPEESMKLKQVDFIWINRDQKCFEWFVSLLTKLELQQTDAGSEDFLKMQMYMTSALGKSDMKGLGLQMALEILHKKENKDAITGLKTRTQAGRPDWKQVFTTISEANRGKVKVFFCGSPALSKELKKHCEAFGFAFSKENF